MQTYLYDNKFRIQDINFLQNMQLAVKTHATSITLKIAFIQGKRAYISNLFSGVN